MKTKTKLCPGSDVRVGTSVSPAALLDRLGEREIRRHAQPLTNSGVNGDLEDDVDDQCEERDMKLLRG